MVRSPDMEAIAAMVITVRALSLHGQTVLRPAFPREMARQIRRARCE